MKYRKKESVPKSLYKGFYILRNSMMGTYDVAVFPGIIKYMAPSRKKAEAYVDGLVSEKFGEGTKYNPRLKNPDFPQPGTPEWLLAKSSGPLWKYEDARGVTHFGYMGKYLDRGGTDQTAFMYDRESGELSVVSGSRMMKMARANPKHKELMKNPRNEYEVLVGNVGYVYRGGSLKEAQQKFSTYVAQSKTHGMRASGEDVTILRNSEPIKEYQGYVAAADFEPYENNPPVVIYDKVLNIVARKGPGHRCDTACKRAGHVYEHKFSGKIDSEILGNKNGSLTIHQKAK